MWLLIQYKIAVVLADIAFWIWQRIEWWSCDLTGEEALNFPPKPDWIDWETYAKAKNRRRQRK